MVGIYTGLGSGGWYLHETGVWWLVSTRDWGPVVGIYMRLGSGGWYVHETGVWWLVFT